MSTSATRPSAADLKAVTAALLALGGSPAAPEAAPAARGFAARGRPLSRERGEALPVLELAAAQLAKGAGLRAAKRAGWHFLVRGAAESVGAELRRGRGRGRGRGRRAVVMLSGPQQVALTTLLASDRRRAAGARLLRIPALCVTAVWFRDRAGAEVVPLPPAFPPFDALEPLPGRTFLRLARDAARRLLRDVRETRRPRGGRRRRP